MTCMLSFVLFTFFPLLQESLPYAPHPTRPVVAEDWKSQRWVALEPSWANAWAGGGDFRQNPLAERGRFLKAELGWSDSELREWIHQSSLTSLWSWELKKNDQVYAGGTQVFTPYALASSGAVQDQSVLVDFDVEIASNSAVADPVFSNVGSGASLGVQFSPVPGKGWLAEFALAISLLNTDEKIKLSPANMDGKHRIQVQLVEVGGKTFLEHGMSIFQFQTPGDPTRWTLKVSTDAPAPPTCFQVSEEVWCVDAPPLPTWTTESLYQKWETSMIFMDAEGPLVFMTKESATQAAKEWGQPVFNLPHEVHFMEGDQEAVVFQGPLLFGSPLYLALGTETEALVDWDAEIAQGARIMDPEIERLFRGLTGTFQVVSFTEQTTSLDLLGNHWKGEEVEAHLDFEWTSADPVASTRNLQVGGRILGHIGGEHPAPTQEALWLPVEFPQVFRIPFAGVFQGIPVSVSSWATLPGHEPQPAVQRRLRVKF